MNRALRIHQPRAVLPEHFPRGGAVGDRDEAAKLDDPDGGDPCVRPWMN